MGAVPFGRLPTGGVTGPNGASRHPPKDRLATRQEMRDPVVVRERIRSRLDKLTAHERATATLHFDGDPNVYRRHSDELQNILYQFFFYPEGYRRRYEIALADVLREVRTIAWSTPEDMVRYALRTPHGRLELRYDPDPDPWSTAHARAA